MVLRYATFFLNEKKKTNKKLQLMRDTFKKMNAQLVF